jgi:hypothetical protein
MFTNENFTEVTERENFDFAYDELSEYAKKLLSKCYNSTLASPLSFCRIMQESATGAKYVALCEVEKYLINE